MPRPIRRAGGQPSGPRARSPEPAPAPRSARRARAPLALVAATTLAATFALGCSTQLPLGQEGSPCDEDVQCDPAQGLSCQCVKRRSPDDEGPDQILVHGFCSFKGAKCPSDAGVFEGGAIDAGAIDTGAIDAGAESAADAPSEADAASSG